MGILDKGETSAPPLGADYEHREEYRPPVWYRRGEENPFLRMTKVSSRKGKGLRMVKNETKVAEKKAGVVGQSDDAALVLSAVRAGRGVGRDIAAATGLSVQKVGALLSRLSQLKSITKDEAGRWVDSMVPAAKEGIPKPRRTAGVADRLAGVVHTDQPKIRDQTGMETSAGFARIMENSRRLNGILGETLLLIQEIHDLNQDLADELYQLQRSQPVLEKAS
ncbi:MAG: hypothetical protein ACYCSH_00110 [Acidithiobacillus sp.]